MGLRGSRNKEMRALTIAAFRIAQNNDQLSEAPMNKPLVKFLLANSDTAINYWEQKGRLVDEGSSYRLTPAGIVECQNTLLGKAGAYSTTEEKVEEWLERMLHGDYVATERREFQPICWAA